MRGPLRWGTHDSAWAAGIGALLVWAAGVNGGVFLVSDNDVNSLLMMALFLGAAILCYAIVVYLLARSPAAGTAPRSAAPMR
jgi:hypothetical protein